MRRIIFSIIVLASVFSCKNQGGYKVDNDSQKINDSLAQINLVRQQDSIERERIFVALGDTIFGTVRYGMSQVQANLAISKFEKLLKNKNGLGFFLMDIISNQWTISLILKICVQTILSLIHMVILPDVNLS